MLPNRAVYISEKSGRKEEVFLNKYGEKVVHILCYLDSCINRFNLTTFSIEELIVNAGMKVDAHKGRSIEQFKKALMQLECDGILIDVSVDLKEAKSRDHITCEFNIPFDKNKGNDQHSKFFMLDRKAYLKVMKSETKINKVSTFNTYCYLLSRMYKRKESDGLIQVNGGKAETCYPSYEEVCLDLNISPSTFQRHIEHLEEMNLIYFDNIGQVVKDGKVSSAVNCYCKEIIHLSYALDQSRFYYEHEGYKVLKEKCNCDKYKNDKIEDKVAEFKSKQVNSETKVINLIETQKSNVNEKRDFGKLYEYVHNEILDYDKNTKLTSHQRWYLTSLRSGEKIKRGGKVEANGYPYDVILNTFKVKNLDIKKALSVKHFEDENRKFDYIMGIILNSINDVYLRHKHNNQSMERLANIAIDVSHESLEASREKYKKRQSELKNKNGDKVSRVLDFDRVKEKAVVNNETDEILKEIENL